MTGYKGDIDGLRRHCGIGAGVNVENMIIKGVNSTLTHLNILPEAETLNCEFRDLSLVGTLDGGSMVRDCDVWDINYVNGQIMDSMLNGIITLGGNVYAHLIDCYSGIPGTFTPIIDLGGSGQALGVRDYHGGLKLINKHGPEAVSIDISSGQIILADDVTNGTIVLRGIGKLTDLSTGSANVLADDLLNKNNIIESVMSGVEAEVNGYTRPIGAVTTGTNTATTFNTNRTESISDVWKDCLLLFTSGSLRDQVKKVTAYNATTNYITVLGGFTSAPVAGDEFLLLNF
jgi:hypothetical protein